MPSTWPTDSWKSPSAGIKKEASGRHCVHQPTEMMELAQLVEGLKMEPSKAEPWEIAGHFYTRRPGGSGQHGRSWAWRIFISWRKPSRWWVRLKNPSSTVQKRIHKLLKDGCDPEGLDTSSMGTPHGRMLGCPIPAAMGVGVILISGWMSLEEPEDQEEDRNLG